MNRFGKRWIAAGLCVALAASMLTGCSSVNKNDVVMTVDDTKVTLGEAAFWLRYNQANTEMYLGGLFGDGNMWEQDLFGTGEAYGTTIKEQILEDIKEMVLMEQHASEYSVALTAEEEAAIDEAAQAFLEANDDKTLKAMYADAETVDRMLTLRTIREKMETEIKKGVDTNVTDEEAAQKSIQYVSFTASSTTDEDGNTVDPTDEEKEAVKQQAQDVIDVVNGGKTLEDAVAEVDEEKNVVSSTYGDDNTTLNDALKEAADALSDGEICAEPVEMSSGNGWYVVQMVSTFDEEATEDRKAEIITDRENDLVTTTLEGWEPEVYEVDEELWAKITFNVGFNAPEAETEATEAGNTEAETTAESETEAGSTEAAEETEAETAAETETEAESAEAKTTAESETEAESTEAAEETEAETTAETGTEAE